jgi:hypothetical protein
MTTARLIALNSKQAPVLPKCIVDIEGELYIDSYTALTTAFPNWLIRLGLGGLIGWCHSYWYALRKNKWYVYPGAMCDLIQVDAATDIMYQLGIKPLWISHVERELSKTYKERIECTPKEAIEYAYSIRNPEDKGAKPLEDILAINLPHIHVEKVKESPFDFIIFRIFAFFYSIYLDLKPNAVVKQ